MTLVSEDMRNYTEAPEDHIYLYSHRWDVLWIGQCGDNLRDNEKVTAFKSPAVVPLSAYKC